MGFHGSGDVEIHHPHLQGGDHNHDEHQLGPGASSHDQERPNRQPLTVSRIPSVSSFTTFRNGGFTLSYLKISNPNGISHRSPALIGEVISTLTMCDLMQAYHIKGALRSAQHTERIVFLQAQLTFGPNVSFFPWIECDFFRRKRLATLKPFKFSRLQEPFRSKTGKNTLNGQEFLCFTSPTSDSTLSSSRNNQAHG